MSQLKYEPCAHCGGRMKSRGGGRIRCVGCGRCRAKDAPLSHIPADHFVKGVSTLVGSDGQPKQQWIKTQKEAETREEALKRLLKEIPKLVPKRPHKSPKPPKRMRKDVLSVYPIGDAHLGMQAWAEETGEDFDLKIAKDRLGKAMSYLVERGEPTEDALIVNLGDFFHADNNAGVTSRSGNSLDTDTRWSKTLRVGLATMVGMVETALSRHKNVHVIVEIGNHDDHSAIFLGIALDAYYRLESRVSIDLSPAKFHYYKFGKCFIGVTHGDTVKLDALESIMATDRPKEWGDSVYRYWYAGHVHHSRKLEKRGCLIETFRTLAAKDAWHFAHGYRAGMDMNKILLHEEYGEIFRATCDVRFISDKR